MSSYARETVQCSLLFTEITEAKKLPNFENGHNLPLQNIMFKIREYEGTIEEFVQRIEPSASPYLKDRSIQYRNKEALAQVLDVAKKYESILVRLVEHADGTMMTQRIERVPEEKRAEFIERYKMTYVNYLATYKKLVEQLEFFQTQDPSQWDNKIARDILMDMHNQMGAAHNRF